MNELTNSKPQANINLAPIDAIDWRQKLDGIVGLNAELGLYRIRGNLEGYKRMLTAFVSGHAEEVSQLTNALVSDDRSTLKEVAHSLKGSGGTIGAERLADAATALDSALHNKAARSDIEAHSTTLIAELTTLIDGIRNTLK
jgi:two-component system sensor histidine kinase/response regulator